MWCHHHTRWCDTTTTPCSPHTPTQPFTQGNNDGRNLDEAPQFRSKEVSKRSVLDDAVESNGLLYAPGETPDHVVVIKCV